LPIGDVSNYHSPGAALRIGLTATRSRKVEEPYVKTRTSRAIGISAAIAAITMSLPLAITAQADPPAEPTVVKPPDPQGNCDPVRDQLAASGATWTTLNTLPVGAALAKIPSISTFYSAISGGLDPSVNIIPVLENGPYVVFAPTNDAFAALEPGQLDALKTDPAALTKLDYYHVFLGLLGNDDVKGQRPTQQGADIKVTGSGGDIKINDDAKMICGAIQTSNAKIYIIDKVLNPDTAPAPVGRTSSTATTTTTTAAAEAPAS
jgi:uncharacterized surface protein with fasciclin (FAS1) repeats